MSSGRFSGPLFVVGAPRSGTKLLRDLLNRHPGIGIPIAETHCIPYLVRKYGEPPRLQDTEAARRFCDDLAQTAFSWHMKRFGLGLETERFVKEADRGSWLSIFEYLLRFYAADGKEPGFIWGDKTPSYLSRIDLLKALFPPARFLHIIRDPRDASLSARKAWGKSVYRTAETWRRNLEAAQFRGKQLGRDYLEIHFESLLEDPRGVLGRICEFLECQFREEMTEPGRAGENLGEAKGVTRIISGNQKKYRRELSPGEIRRIEEIVYPVLTRLPYEVEKARAFRPLGPLGAVVLRAYDKLQRLRFDIASKGIRDGLRFHYKFRW